MRLTIDKFSNNDGRKLSREVLKEYGKSAKLFKGVSVWFDRINDHALARNLKLEHYIISSGLKEMIEGCVIASNFEYIFASHYSWDETTGNALWPAVAVNYTTNWNRYIGIEGITGTGKTTLSKVLVETGAMAKHI
ncbi:MAG: hypothetical protein KZQ95_11885 [Candidatus Thiodiazotropha sp. (ex Epidulcina cf. delphinae)]|nr:hypothetical protein [Candidatus Thiodiazotropha sp. (ex Epidulcina cf. delphinae)]